MNAQQHKMTLDFSEIISPAKFEQFVADLLRCLGYKIEVGPGEGPDGGKDMIVSDILEGRIAKQKVKYLVSCKHYTSRPVGVNDEIDIEARVRSHNCDAFLAVYSTHISEHLVQRFEGLRTSHHRGGRFDIITLQDADIRQHLLELSDGPRLVRQWFPNSHAAYLRAVTESHVYRNRPEMRCAICKADLLNDFSGSILYSGTYGPATSPSRNPERDLSHRPYIHDISPLCIEHTPPKESLPNGSMLFDLDSLIAPRGYIDRLSEDVQFMYKWPPYFVDEKVYLKWNSLISILYYFVARARPGPASEPARRTPFPLFHNHRYKL